MESDNLTLPPSAVEGGKGAPGGKTPPLPLTVGVGPKGAPAALFQLRQPPLPLFCRNVCGSAFSPLQDL